MTSEQYVEAIIRLMEMAASHQDLQDPRFQSILTDAIDNLTEYAVLQNIGE